MPSTYSTDLLLLEPVDASEEEILRWANNPASVTRYLECLDRGWLGQALRERYSFDDSNDGSTTPMHMNSFQSDGMSFERFEHTDDQIKEDLRDCINGNHGCIPITLETFVKGLDTTDDPGANLLQELVEMMEIGLKNMPKILVTVSGLQGGMVGPVLNLPWHNGIEDAVAQLSAKIMDKAVLQTDFKKSGRDLHVSYRIDDRQDNQAALAFIEDLGKWQ